jgi:hypothetical protein
MPPEQPPIAGQLRFRITSNDDHASFESGSDLLLPNGVPWLLPLYTLSKYYLPLYEKLREDRLVSDDLDTALSTLPAKRTHYNMKLPLYTLNDTFILDFSCRLLRFSVVTEQGMEALQIERTFIDSRVMFDLAPYTGAYTKKHLSILLY